MSTQIIKSVGYSSDICGYSGAFSWFRSTEKPGYWHVVSHVAGFSTGGWAVTDDFGNFVRVPA